MLNITIPEELFFKHIPRLQQSELINSADTVKNEDRLLTFYNVRHPKEER